jgi:hypothetical protein
MYDPILRTRLACVIDLTVADGKHHSSCHVRFKRSTDKISKSALTASDVVLLWLCHELEQLAPHADIIELTTFPLVSFWQTMHKFQLICATLLHRRISCD